MRRKELLIGGIGVAAMGMAAGARGSERFVLSEHGCGRATGYAEAVKVVSWGGKTHVG